jgi:hypothetical protein
LTFTDPYHVNFIVGRRYHARGIPYASTTFLPRDKLALRQRFTAQKPIEKAGYPIKAEQVQTTPHTLIIETDENNKYELTLILDEITPAKPMFPLRAATAGLANPTAIQRLQEDLARAESELENIRHRFKEDRDAWVNREKQSAEGKYNVLRTSR